MRVAIVGGGIYGVATAYFLARFGADDVVVYERDTVASGSTGYSAGIVRHHYSAEAQIRTAARGRDILASLPAHVGHDGGFHENGYLKLAGESDAAAFERTVATMERVGVEVVRVDPADVGEYLAGCNPDGVAAAAYEPTAGFADPYLVATGFADAARERGVRIETGVPVTDLRVEDGAITGVAVTGEVEAADAVVNAAGSAGADVAGMAGVDLPLAVHESKIAVLESITPYGPDLPTLSDHTGTTDMYVKPEPGGDFIVGGIDRPAVDPNRGLEGVTGDFLRRVGERLEHRLPPYADAGVADTWSGPITVTPDATQIVGEPGAVDGLYLAVGGSGHGFKEAPAIAESLAQTILGLDPTLDLHPYRLSRFADGETFGGIAHETYAPD